ncbi:unnamed protein product [Blepharisma stoltei]|uniref:RING-type domain-containing protein n=1 Tax=Blepharisma stoltei TaxID=1481888 RepID=A0AAU9JPE8_9CILI|nr:unnamed protein product [Blepharisma stoltei]
METCAICLENLESQDRGILYPCKHSLFHSSCVSHWGDICNKCPVCKMTFQNINDMKVEDQNNLPKRIIIYKRDLSESEYESSDESEFEGEIEPIQYPPRARLPRKCRVHSALKI